jgi:hypothetical protein
VERQAIAQTRTIAQHIAKGATSYSLTQARDSVSALATALLAALDAITRIDNEGSQRLYTAAMQPKNAIVESGINRHIVHLCRQLRLRRPPEPKERPSINDVRLPAMYFVPHPDFK